MLFFINFDRFHRIVIAIPSLNATASAPLNVSPVPYPLRLL
ncbi:hypothetical protein [Macrococcoides caseolyticum]|nr:hypothetical protein [Macrococcus caseolyticus]